MLFDVALLVGMLYAIAAFALRNAPPPVARVLWGLVWLLMLATAVLVVALIRDPALNRAFFG
jgi:xanthosine utilization system XapX-like protein